MARRQQRAAEYRFKIEAFSPETMPMARLADYLRELAAILGEPKSVHLVRLEAGSTVLVHRIEREAIPKVRDRASAVKRGDAPRDALQAYKTVNRFLREDNGRAVLREKQRGAPILVFPGRDEAEERFPSVRQQGTIDGEIVRVGGTDETVPIMLRSEGEVVVGCWADKRLAKQLAEHLFEPVRLHGSGRWARDPEGRWTLQEFKVESFDRLAQESLGAAITKLRLVSGGEWESKAYEEMETIRHASGRRRGRS